MNSVNIALLQANKMYKLYNKKLKDVWICINDITNECWYTTTLSSIEIPENECSVKNAEPFGRSPDPWRIPRAYSSPQIDCNKFL